MKFQVRVGELRAAMLFVSEDETRYVLNGVNFDIQPDKPPLMVATDGRRLGVIATEVEQADPITEPLSFTLQTDFIKSIAALAKKATTDVEIEYTADTDGIIIRIGEETTLTCTKGAVIEGNYPKWREVCPSGDKEPVGGIGLNAQYVGDYQKAAKLLGVDPVIEMNIYGKDSAIEVSIGGKPNFYSVIMPMKSSEEKTNWQPEFLGLETAEQLKKEKMK